MSINNIPTVQNLIMIFIGVDQFISLLPLFKLVNQHDGNIIKSKISQYGSHFTGSLLIEGRWDTLTKIENATLSLENDLKLKIHTERINQDQHVSAENSELKQYLPYKMSITNLDEPGLLEKITEFFVLQEISIQDLNAITYTAEFGEELAQIDIKIKIPSDVHIPSLREQFDILCYNENLDASLTPYKAM